MPKAKLSLFANGHKVGESDAVDLVEQLGGAAFSLSATDLRLHVAVELQSEALAVVEERQSFGTLALEALLGALPACGMLDCSQPVTHEGDRCDSHRNGGGRVPYAEVVHAMQRRIAEAKR